MAEQILTLVPKKDANMIGKFMEGKKKNKNKMFDPFVNETDNGRFAWSEKMVEKATAYCTKNNIQIDFTAMNTKKMSNVVFKPNTVIV